MLLFLQSVHVYTKADVSWGCHGGHGSVDCHHIQHEDCPEGFAVLARLDVYSPWQDYLANSTMAGVYL